MLARLQSVVVFLLFFTSIAAHRNHRKRDRNSRNNANSDRNQNYETSKFLSRLISSKNGPVVVFLDSNKPDKSYKASELRANDEEKDISSDYQPEPGENEAYLFYDLLRSTQENEVLDTEAERIFENTKNILREALSLRCAKRQKCEDECEVQDSNKCPGICEKIFDVLNVCKKPKSKPAIDCKPTNNLPNCNWNIPKPKPDCNPQRGKTMPPKWLRTLLNSIQDKK